MRNHYVLGLMSLFIFTACGKSMQLVAKPDQTLVGAPDMVDGKILPLSQYDLSLQSPLPFLDADNKGEAAFHQFGNPSFYTTNDKGKIGYVKASNVGFRSFVQVPPANAIKAIRSFKLVLNDVRVYAEAGTKAEDVVASQILCVLDKKVCIGGKQDRADKNHNPAFWGTAPAEKEAALVKMDDLRSIAVSDTKGLVYAYNPGAPASTIVAPPATAPGVAPTVVPPVTPPTVPTAPVPPSASDEGLGELDVANVGPSVDANVNSASAAAAPPAGAGPTVLPILTIDLKADLGLSDADLAKWIVDNSSVFEKTKNYRKFQFVFGNNFYASEGHLEFQFDVDPSVPLPPNFNSAPGKLLHGAKDQNKKTDLLGGGGRLAVVKINKDGFAEIDSWLDENTVVFDAKTNGLAENANGGLSDLVATLNTYAPQVTSISIVGQMDAGSDKASNQSLAEKHALAVKTRFSDLGLKVTQVSSRGRVAKTTSPDPSDDRKIHLRIVTNLTDVNAAGPQAIAKIISDKEGLESPVDFKNTEEN